MSGEAESTRAVARVVGPTLIAAGLFVLVRRRELPDLVHAFVRDDLAGMIAGFVGFIAGLVLLAVHSRISSLAALALTLTGWLLVVRGLVLLFAPQLLPAAADWFVARPLAFDVMGVAIALAGAWLSTVGFSARPPPIAS
jgi:hypothetical protein